MLKLAGVDSSHRRMKEQRTDRPCCPEATRFHVHHTRSLVDLDLVNVEAKPEVRLLQPHPFHEMDEAIKAYFASEDEIGEAICARDVQLTKSILDHELKRIYWIYFVTRRQSILCSIKSKYARLIPKRGYVYQNI